MILSSKYLTHLSNDDLRNLLIECDNISRLEKPSLGKKSEKLNDLFIKVQTESFESYWSSYFSDLIKTIELEIINRFKKNKLC